MVHEQAKLKEKSSVIIKPDEEEEEEDDDDDRSTRFNIRSELLHNS